VSDPFRIPRAGWEASPGCRLGCDRSQRERRLFRGRGRWLRNQPSAAWRSARSTRPSSLPSPDGSDVSEGGGSIAPLRSTASPAQCGSRPSREPFGEHGAGGSTSCVPNPGSIQLTGCGQRTANPVSLQLLSASRGQRPGGVKTNSQAAAKATVATKSWRNRDTPPIVLKLIRRALYPKREPELPNDAR